MFYNMAQDIGLKKTIVDLILDILKAQLGTTYKAYFYGDPIAIQQSLLPAIAIDIERTEYSFGPTGFDEVTHHLIIQVIYNKKDEFMKPAREVGLSRKLQNQTMGRNATNGEFIAGSIMGLLRRNITLNNVTINQTAEIQFGVVPRPEDTLTVEAHIRIAITELTPIANRN